MRNVFALGSVFGAGAAAVASGAASLCCIGPAAISILGVHGAILAAGMKPYRPYLLAASLGMLAWAHWRTYRAAGARAPSCSIRRGRMTRGILWGATVTWAGAVMIQYFADRFWL